MWRRLLRTDRSKGSDRLRDAERLADAAEADLARVRRRQPRVDELGESLREHLRRNHFAEKLELSIRRRTT